MAIKILEWQQWCRSSVLINTVDYILLISLMKTMTRLILLINLWPHHSVYGFIFWPKFSHKVQLKRIYETIIGGKKKFHVKFLLTRKRLSFIYFRNATCFIKWYVINRYPSIKRRISSSFKSDLNRGKFIVPTFS